MNRLLKALVLTLVMQWSEKPVLLHAQDLPLDFIYGGIQDAETILQEYLKPYANILGSDLNAGWYNTARPHKLGGFDVTATVSWARAPMAALDFDLSALNLNGTINGTSTGVAPTIAGSQETRPELVYSENVDLGGGNIQEVEFARFTIPNGTGIQLLPLPMAQLSAGLPFGTDVSVRFIPLFEFRDYGKVGMWGVGGKHSLSQWIPVVKSLKFLDIALQGGYTKVTSSVHLRVEPLPVEVEPAEQHNWNDQNITQNVQGWTLNLIASETLPIISFYQGIGYASSLVELLLEGHYPVHSVVLDPGPDLGKTTYAVIEDPVSTEFENYNNLRINAGVRIKLGILTLHYDFTHTLYSTQSVGIGISFR